MRVSGFLFAVLLGCASTPSAVAPASDVEAALLDRVRAFGDAYRDGDVAGVDALLAARYVHSNGGRPPSDREGYLEWNRLRAAKLSSGSWRVEQYDVTELRIVRFGTSAVVTGRVAARGVRDGETWSSDVRFSNLWITEDGQWRRAAFHDAKTVTDSNP